MDACRQRRCADAVHREELRGDGGDTDTSASVQRVSARVQGQKPRDIRTIFVRARRHARTRLQPSSCATGARYASVGSTGSERMASGIFEVLLRLANHTTPFEAVHAPRLHCTPERTVCWEEARFPNGFRDALLRHGFTVEATRSLLLQDGRVATGRCDKTASASASPNRDETARPELRSNREHREGVVETASLSAARHRCARKQALEDRDQLPSAPDGTERRSVCRHRSRSPR